MDLPTRLVGLQHSKPPNLPLGASVEQNSKISDENFDENFSLSDQQCDEMETEDIIAEALDVNNESRDSAEPLNPPPMTIGGKTLCPNQGKKHFGRPRSSLSPLIFLEIR
jgi:hypothetical protein